MKRAVLNDVLACKPDKPLYHYTNQTGLLGIVRSKEMWVTHTQYLNDRREFVHAVDLVREEIARLSKDGSPENSPRSVCLSRMDKSLQLSPQTINVCVCSFSEDRDSLSQWRAYGSRASGFAIGFPPDLLAAAAAKREWYLAPCIYDSARQREVVRLLVEEVLEENLARLPLVVPSGSPEVDKEVEELFYAQGGNLLPYLYRYAPILKDLSFSEEREWRVITRPLFSHGESFCYREGRSSLVPYSKFSLSGENLKFRLHEIVVGPTPDAARSQNSVRSFLKHEELLSGWQEQVVKISKVPYRDW